MSKKALKPEERKIKFTISINPKLFNKMNINQSNKSKYIEWLIYNDLKNKGQIKDIIL
jgi:hypothetical protein